jgi:hypothetical protein
MADAAHSPLNEQPKDPGVNFEIVVEFVVVDIDRDRINSYPSPERPDRNEYLVVHIGTALVVVACVVVVVVLVVVVGTVFAAIVVVVVASVVVVVVEIVVVVVALEMIVDFVETLVDFPASALRESP